jgi:hypothetical protein
MLKTYASRVAAGAVISAALTAGSLGLTATAASACTNPNCVSGTPPVAVAAMECTNPKCLSGIPPVTAPAMECTDPKCLSGVPPVAASAMECTNPRCISGSPPVAASAMECTDTGCHSGTRPARAAGEVSTAASAVAAHAGTSASINCPPPHPEVTALIRGVSDC